MPRQIRLTARSNHSRGQRTLGLPVEPNKRKNFLLLHYARHQPSRRSTVGPWHSPSLLRTDQSEYRSSPGVIQVIASIKCRDVARTCWRSTDSQVPTPTHASSHALTGLTPHPEALYAAKDFGSGDWGSCIPLNRIGRWA